MPTPNFGLPLYTTSDTAALDTLLNGQSSALDAALLANVWHFGGTNANRIALAAPKLREGVRFRTTDTDRDWYYDGSNWIADDNGAFLIRPTGTIGSGVSIGADGTITFTSATATGAGISGAFTSRFKSYAVHYSLTHATSNLQFRMASGGAAISTSNYITSTAHITGSSITAASATTSVGTVNSVVGLAHTGVLELFDAADAAKNTSYNFHGNGQELPSWGGGWFNSAAAHDGLVILPGAAVVFSGWMKIYGMA